MPSPYDLTFEELAAILGDEPAYRVRQVWEGLHVRVQRPEEMTDLPASLRASLGAASGTRADRGLPPHGRPGADHQVAVVAGRRHPGGDGADGVRRPGHRLRVHPGRVRHGLPVLRHRAGRVPTAPHRRRDRRTGGGGHAGRPTASTVERGVHGDGRAAGQLRPGVGGRRPAARRHGSVRPPPDLVDGGTRPGHPPAGHRVTAREPGRVAARGQRRVARRAGPDQPALPAGPAGPGVCRLRGRQRAPVVDRVGHDRRGQRQWQRRRGAGCVRPPAGCPREPHSVEPDTGVRRGGLTGDARSAASATSSEPKGSTPPSG